MGKGIGSILPFAAMAAPFMFPALGAGIGAATPAAFGSGSALGGMAFGPMAAGAGLFDFGVPLGATLAGEIAAGGMPAAGLFGGLGGSLGGLMDNKALQLGMKMINQGDNRTNEQRPPMLIPMPSGGVGSAVPMTGIIPPGTSTSPYGGSSPSYAEVGLPPMAALMRRRQEQYG